VIIALVREKELMSKHMQQLVAGTTPTTTISGGTPKSSDGATPLATNTGIQKVLHHESYSGSQLQEKRLASELEPRRSEEKNVVSRSAQTDSNLLSGRASVGGRRPVEVEVKGSGIRCFETRKNGQSMDGKDNGKEHGIKLVENRRYSGRDVTGTSRQPSGRLARFPGKGKSGCSDHSFNERTAGHDGTRESITPPLLPSPSAHQAGKFCWSLSVRCFQMLWLPLFQF